MWVHEHVGVYTCWFSKCGERPAPLGLHRGNSGFAVEHLTLSCCLSLVCHYKEMAAPHSSFSQVTIEMRARNARAVGLDLNSVAVETQRGPNIGRGGSITERGVGFYCQIFEELLVGGKTRLDLKKAVKGQRRKSKRNGWEGEKNGLFCSQPGDKGLTLCDKCCFI